MNFNQIEEIKKAGFTGFVRIRELLENWSMIPPEKGVYLILNIDERPIDFLTIGSGGYFKGKNPNVSVEILKYNWVDNTKVIYIGKATSLKSRLKQYLRFGQGKNIGHYGGRLIWQLKHSTDLVICWKPLIDAEPRQVESNLIKLFMLAYSKRPFANLTN